MVLVKRPRDLVEGAGRCGEVVVVRRALVAVHGGEGVARGFEGVDLVILQIGVAEVAVERSLRAVAPRQDVAGLLGGAVVHTELLLPCLGEAVEAVQLRSCAIQTV